MKAIIAGGRDYDFTEDDFRALDKLHSQYQFTQIVSGGAAGADSSGEEFAMMECIEIKRFPADWDTHGRAAGPIRNKAMAEYADCLILFPGGKGSQNMHKLAKEQGLRVFVRQE